MRAWSTSGPSAASLLLSLLGAAGCYSGNQPQETDATASASDDPSAGASAGDAGDGTDTDTDGAAPVVAWSPMHRLNRLEYNNTLRDLLGTSLRPADAFGPDPEANGFDNMAAQLRVSSSLIDAYDQAARAALADALDDQPAFRVELRGDELHVEGGYRVGDLWALSGQPLSVQISAPEPVDAEIVLDAGMMYGGAAPAPQARLRVNGVDLPPFAVQGSAAIPAPHVQPISLTAGIHTIELVPTNYVNLPAQNDFNNVFVAGLSVRSLNMVPGPGRSRIYTCEPAGDGDLACYHQIIADFAARAWRRPLTPDEAAELTALSTQLLAQGEGADQALRLVLRGVLLSPKFFYRARTTEDADGDGWLDDYVLASRLSYFLWSSMPDDRLFEMAAEGRLATDEGLSEAVELMLADPKAQALLDGFAEQWLATRHLAGYSPNPEIYPAFTAEVRAAMIAESKLFFGDFLRNDLPVADLIHPDFAYRSDLLAAHYGEPPVGSPGPLLRVPAEGADRRGLLALGAWLTATSDADHSSPIRRGRWASERLLCTPIPPPPPGVVFDPPDFGGADSVREALEMHRSDPNCAGCHALLDVLGIGFEEYNGVAQPVLDPELDNLGELPDGRTFNGAHELSALYADSDVFVECFTRTLFTYAAGRPAGPHDALPLRELALSARAEAATLPQLIDALVHTPNFRGPAPLDPAE